MTDAVEQVREALAKAEAKAKRLRSQLESAEQELGELETAMRVFERLTGAKPTQAANQSENGALIWQYVGTVAQKRAPKDIIELLRNAGHDLGADLVRTQLWRMAKRGELKSEDGLYWRPLFPGTMIEPDSGQDEDESKPEDEAAPEPPASRGWGPSSTWQTSPGPPPPVLDDDIPF